MVNSMSKSKIQVFKDSQKGRPDRWRVDGQIHDAGIRKKLGFDQAGSRIRKFFKKDEYDDARHLVDRANDLIRENRVYRNTRTTLSEAEQEACEQVFEEFPIATAELHKAVKEYVKSYNRDQSVLTPLEEIFEQYKEEKGKARSDATMKNYSIRIERGLTKMKLKKKPAHTLTRNKLFKTIYREKVSRRSQYNDRQAWYNFCEFLKDNEFLDSNPVADIPKPNVPESKKTVLTPDQMKELLKVAMDKGGSMAPCLAICAFAGLRRQAEYMRLKEQNIDLDKGDIYVPPGKVTSGRYVKIEPVLMDWLKLFKERGIALIFYGRKQFETICIRADVEWHADILRRSYASYMALFKTVYQLKDLMGTSEKTIRAHYQSPQREDVAKKWWENTPAKVMD